MSTVHNPLLPYASTGFEHRVTDVMADNSRLAVQIDTLTRVGDVPDDFLSFLAWQYSVDSWDTAWQPSLQRELIKKSFHQHCIKGTIQAVREILEKFGYEATFTEWWQAKPPLKAGSFQLDLSTSNRAMTEETYRELNRLIADAKPVSRHLEKLTVELTPFAEVLMGVGLHIGEYISVYPE